MPATSQPQTIFLTPEENERIRNTFEDRSQRCQDLSGKPRISSGPKSHQNQITMASLLSDMAIEPGPKSQKARSDAIVAFAVGIPYPPCIVPIQDLKPMQLSDLRMNTHHRGFVLTVRRVSPVVKLLVYTWTIVQEDASGEMERLEISLHKTKHNEDILESGTIFQLKEPYFTLSDDCEPTLRVDHPSDLVICTDSATLADKTAKDLKEEGNAALQQRLPLLAHKKYTEGLQTIQQKGKKQVDVGQDLFRNRAHVNLLLNRFDEAKMDALSSLNGIEDERHKELDSKAYLRAGIAAYNLGEFDDARRCFQEQQKLIPSLKEGTARLRKTELRLKEQETGGYNFKKMKVAISVAQPRVDAASFVRNVEVRESPGCGRGLFATRSIALGEIILCEKAFCVVWGHENEALTTMTYDSRASRIRVCPAGLCKAVVQKLLDNPSQIEKVLDLYGDYSGLGKDLILRDSKPVVDTFQVHDIVARNAFGPGSVDSSQHDGGGEGSNENAGLWILASYANHSCLSNAKKESTGDLMVMRATRKIAAGEEITHSYDSSTDYESRTGALMDTWGFKCNCLLCIAEEADGPALRKKRRDLEVEANALVEREASVGRRILDIVRARRLARSIGDTYDEDKYRDLPRPALTRIEEWLAKATIR